MLRTAQSAAERRGPAPLGVMFLIDTQEAGGGWTYPPQYGEVNSEALMALGAAQLDNGNHTGVTDPQPGSGNDRHPAEPTS